ncbi:MAG: shikimate dehydrogenase [Actinomycetes bacterium]
MHAAVLGSPVSHSLSPCIHNAAYRATQLAHDYSAIEVVAQDLVSFVSQLDESWMGLSLTMPLKEVAFEVAHEVTPVATLARSINTLILGDVITADNTDVYGIVRAVQENWDEPIARLVLIGSGATARSAIIAAHELEVRSIDILARNSAAIANCEELAQQLGMTLTNISIEQVSTTPSTLTVNTTPVGVADEIARTLTDPSGVLLDVVYHPWPTQLAQRWQDAGLVAIPGHSMLLHQAAKQFELMTSHAAPLEEMRLALRNELDTRGIQ